MSTLNKQEGGSHYKDMKIQPVEFIHANKIPFQEGNAIKYICRHRNKCGAQDLKKAIHFLEMLIELEYPETKAPTVVSPETKAPTMKKPLRQKSLADSPVALTWAICSREVRKNPKISRKDLLDICISAGITRSTAARQLSEWHKGVSDVWTKKFLPMVAGDIIQWGDRYYSVGADHYTKTVRVGGVVTSETEVNYSRPVWF